MTSRPCTPLKQRCSRDKVDLTSQLYCSIGAPYGHDPDTAPFSSAESMRTMVGCRQLHTINSRSIHTSGMEHESAQHFFCKNKHFFCKNMSTGNPILRCACGMPCARKAGSAVARQDKFYFSCVNYGVRIYR